jgi:hypothetical protein
MIFFSIGLPGRLALLCEAIIEVLASASGESVGRLAWPSLDHMLGYHHLNLPLDELALHLIRENRTHLIIGARQPDDGLRQALAEANSRFIVVLDDPRHAVADLMAETGAELRAVTRAVANSCPLMMRYAAMPGTLSIRPSDAEDVRKLAAAIAHHLQLPVADAMLMQLAADPAIAELRNAGGTAAMPSQISDSERRTLDGALAPYAECFAGATMGRLLWTRDLFMIVGNAGTTLSEPLEAAGGARYLTYGPYIHLPPGSWNAQVVLGFSQDTAGHTFLIDACADRQIAATSFQPEGAGIYTIEINFSLGEPSGHGLEIRVMVVSERARGQIAFGHVVLTPVALRHPDAAQADQQDFRAVLAL